MNSQPHPIVNSIVERSDARGDKAMSTWASTTLEGLLREATLVPAKGMTVRERKLLPDTSHLPGQTLEMMGHQSMPAHIMAAALPAGDLAMILGVDHTTRLLALCGITLHDAGKARRSLSRVVSRNNADSINAQRNELEELAHRWGMKPLLDELQQSLDIDRDQLMSVLSWLCSEAEEVRGHNPASSDHGVNNQVWGKLEDDLRLCSILTRLGDLIASLGNEGIDARGMARNERINRMVHDACSNMGKPPVKLQPWTLKRERTMTTMLLQDAMQRAVQEQGGHVWLISRMGGIAILQDKARMPTRQEITTSFHNVVEAYIISKTPASPALTLAGNAPQERKPSNFMLALTPARDIPQQLLQAARSSFNQKDPRAYSMNVAIAIANSCKVLLENEGYDCKKENLNKVLALMLSNAPVEQHPHAAGWTAHMQAHGMGKDKPTKQMLHDHRELPLNPKPGETPLANALAAGTAELLRNAPDRRSEQLIAQAMQEIISDDITLPGEATGQLQRVSETKPSTACCWRCGEPREIIQADQVTGAIQMTGYNARQKPAFAGIKAGACKSCVLEELLLKAEDPERDEARADTYVHVMLDGFASPITAGGLRNATEQIRRKQVWQLSGAITWQREVTEEDKLIQQEEDTDHETPEVWIPDDDDESDTETTQTPPQKGNPLYHKRLLGALPGRVTTHFAVRLNGSSTTENDAIALAAMASLSLAGMRTLISGEVQPPQEGRDAHAMNIEIAAPTWTLWGAGVRNFGLAELPLVLNNIQALNSLARLRKKNGNSDPNTLRNVAQLVSHDPLRAISGRFVETHDNADEAINALEQHLSYLQQVSKTNGGEMNHIRKTQEALNKLSWDGNGYRTHGRTKPLKEALDALTANCRTGMSWQDRQDARDIAVGRVQRMLKDFSDPRHTQELIDTIDRELLEGLCGGSVEKLRQRINEIIQAVDALELSRIRQLAQLKKERENSQPANQPANQQEANI